MVVQASSSNTGKVTVEKSQIRGHLWLFIMSSRPARAAWEPAKVGLVHSLSLLLVFCTASSKILALCLYSFCWEVNKNVSLGQAIVKLKDPRYFCSCMAATSCITVVTDCCYERVDICDKSAFIKECFGRMNVNPSLWSRQTFNPPASASKITG